MAIRERFTRLREDAKRLRDGIDRLRPFRATHNDYSPDMDMEVASDVYLKSVAQCRRHHRCTRPAAQEIRQCSQQEHGPRSVLVGGACDLAQDRRRGDWRGCGGLSDRGIAPRLQSHAARRAGRRSSAAIGHSMAKASITPRVEFSTNAPHIFRCVCRERDRKYRHI